jgi:hypothetical protein
MIKKQIGTVLAALFVAGAAIAASTNQVHNARPVPGYIQKAISESKEVSDLINKVRAENDLVKRESLVSELRMKLTEYADQDGEALALQKQLDASDDQRVPLLKEKMEDADKKQLQEFDKQRDQLIQKITEARWEREMNIDVFVRNLSADSQPAAQ